MSALLLSLVVLTLFLATQRSFVSGVSTGDLTTTKDRRDQLAAVDPARPSTWCVPPAVEKFNDIPSRTVLATIVFQGFVVRTMQSSSATNRSTPVFDVVFSVKQFLKGGADLTTDVQSNSSENTIIVGPFVETDSEELTGKPETENDCGVRLPKLPRSSIPQQLFIVFVSLPMWVTGQQNGTNGLDATNGESATGSDANRPLHWWVWGQPIEATRNSLKTVKSYSCITCGEC